MARPKGWVEIWDSASTGSRFVDPITAKSLLTSERFSDKPFPTEGDDAATKTVTASATEQAVVATPVSAPVAPPLPAQEI